MSFPYLDFFQMIHSMIAYYNPSEGKKAFACMFESAVSMIPAGDPIKSIIRQGLIFNPLNNLENSSKLFQWSYQLNSYVHTRLYGSNYIPFDKFRSKYTDENMTITVWSHPTWKMIHYYASRYDRTSNYALSYKAFVSCLQFLLPCPKCRNHLKDNLANHPIDQYFSSEVDLFTWSYILHQTVSSQLGKVGIPIYDARRLYGLS